MELTTQLTTILCPALAALQLVLPDDVVITWEHPGSMEFGDYATNVAMQLFRHLSSEQRALYPQPRLLAAAVAGQINTSLSSDSIVEKAEAAGAGFVNVWIKPALLWQLTQQITQQGAQYGRGHHGDGQTWAIEHTSPNPNKAMHLGHMRNNVTGMAIANLIANTGTTVIRDCVDNDRGIAIAKLMWGYLKFARRQDSTPVDVAYWFSHQSEWLEPADGGERPDRFVDRLYVLASEDVKNPDIDQQVRQLVIDWEAHDPQNWALWQKVLDYSYAGQQLTLQRLGNKWDKVWHEHEHYQQGKDLVELGLQKGVLRQLADGAILTNLEAMGLSDTVVRKADGTALYITQDLALTKLKKETFHADRLIWVIGPEQSLAMKQMFAVCEQLGIGQREEFTHLAFGSITIKGQGKMSSRAGNVVFIDDLIDQAKTEILAKITNPDLSATEKDSIAEQVAIGAIKYSILHIDRNTNMAFDFATSLSFDGDSGPYLQYTYARCQSVIRKAGLETALPPVTPAATAIPTEEQLLVRWLYRFPTVVEQAAYAFAPNMVCQFLFQTAQYFNSFYNSLSILSAEPVARQRRLLVTAATAQVLHNGLALLGISTPEHM